MLPCSQASEEPRSTQKHESECPPGMDVKNVVGIETPTESGHEGPDGKGKDFVFQHGNTICSGGNSRRCPCCWDSRGQKSARVLDTLSPGNSGDGRDREISLGHDSQTRDAG